MATPLENIETAIDNVSAQLAALQTIRPGYSIEGQSVRSEISELTAQLEALYRLRAMDNPTWTEISRGDT